MVDGNAILLLADNKVLTTKENANPEDFQRLLGMQEDCDEKDKLYMAVMKEQRGRENFDFEIGGVPHLAHNMIF